MIPRWDRPRYPVAPTVYRSRRKMRVELVALLRTPHIHVACERVRDAVPAPVWESLDVEVRSRFGDAGLLEELLAGRAGHALERRAEDERREVDLCQRYATVGAVTPDARVIEVLPAALGVLQALAAEDDLVLALDRATARWWSPEELLALAPDRPFVLDEHVQVVVEAVERRTGVGHLVRSRGLDKFGRPDLGGRGPRREAERVAEVLRDVARLLAEGEVLRPGDRVDVPAAPPLTLVPRSDDCLDDAPPDEAPLYELRDLEPDGPAPSCARLLASMRPRPRRLDVLR